MMMNFNVRLALRVEGQDRLSDMPIDVINHILNFMSIHDAARTSILAKRWRYIWTRHPNLVLDKLTCKKLSMNDKFGFHKTIDKILLQHDGDIIKFVLDTSKVNLLPFIDIDTWINFVIEKGVRELTLDFSNNKTYKFPSCLYSFKNLTHLKLFNCSFKPSTFSFFCPHLKTLFLKQITFMATKLNYILKFPILAKLTIMSCNGIEFLNINSPQLNWLFVIESQYLKLNCFTNCTSLSVVSLSLDKVWKNPKQDDRTTLLKFIFGLPLLTKLYLDDFYLKFLGEAPVVPRSAPVVRDCLRQIMLSIKLTDLAQVSYALLFIQYFLNLQRLHIWVFDTWNSAEDVLKYLEAPHNFDRPLVNLKQVVIRFFNGTKPELLLIKLLLAATPSLEKMSIEKEMNFSSIQERKITAELLHYPRASTKAKIYWRPRRL